ncbi:aminotransferase [Tepiditoga spiralis]|uniref:histidinol-phosphate transaminase n=1 Tax=Tepiditoga spiralis TaxID=2108365 RepID=A0A7G1GB32_9BACT|nr:aminotransferase class I/II-fold pyridoxal phosphate-dependent enzyme [Tepiditoga spiralis]BBE30819.1 aminotransferase [Tepiditoga spiralis]
MHNFENVKHGGNVPLSWIDFSISVNPYKPNFLNSILNNSEKYVDKYLYYEELEEKLSNKLNVNAKLTAGTTESLYLLFSVFKGNLHIKDTSYGEYERVAKIFNKKIYKSKDPLKTLKKNDLIILNNPENPTGKYYSKDYVKDFIHKVLKKGGIPIIDDAFMDFVENIEDNWETTHTYENTIHLRTYTKSYGLPGIRVGYFIDPYNKMKKVKMPWSLGAIGVSFMEEILKDNRKFLKSSMKLIHMERKKFIQKLNIKTDVNFFLFKTKNKRSLIEKLSKNKMMIRDCTSFGLNNTVRIAIRTEEENIKLIDILLKSSV